MKGNASSRAEKLTPRQDRALLALLTKETLKDAAGEVGVSESTLWRWLQDEQFHSAYMRARRESVKQAIANLQQSSSDAVATLREVMVDKDAPKSVRVAAAKTVIELSIKAVEVEDLAQRVDELEQLMQQQAQAVGR